MAIRKVELNNGEKLVGTGLSVFDAKGKAIADGDLPAGTTVVYTASEDPSTIAQIRQAAPNSLACDITTEGDDIGVVLFTGTVTNPDGSIVNDADGTAPQLEVTVIHSAVSSASFTPGVVTPE